MPDPIDDPEFVGWINGLRLSRRARVARDILLERGSVTTAELNDLGYDHPPRVIADLKDAGVSVRREDVRIDGRRMARYTLERTTGSAAELRRVLPRALRDEVFRRHEYRCAVCGGQYSSRELQLDHRVPFRIAGDPTVPAVSDFMPLCGSDNRAKSWTCEHCANWTARDPEMCRTCHWAEPTAYRHVAGEQERRLVISVRGADVATFDRLAAAAAERGTTPGDWVASRLDRLTGE